MKTVILWFRRDLRLADNPALRAAVEEAERVIPVYLHAPEEEAQWAPGGASCWWLHASLQALSQDLAAKQSRLIIRRGQSSLSLLRELIDETGAEGVYWNRLYEPLIVERDRSVKAALREQGVNAKSFRAHLLREPWEMRTGKGEPYRVFTPFWRTLAKQGDPPQPLRQPPTLRPPGQWPSRQTVAELGLLLRPRWDRKLHDLWQPGEAGAALALDHFLDGAMAVYKDGRDLPAESDTARLSPHLHFGEISPHQAWHRARARMAGQARLSEGGEAWLRQLAWREFAHHVLFEFPHSSDEPLYERWAGFPWREGYQPLLRAWQRGETGFPIVDAGMRELWATGYMHNRVRMIAASLLVKNIRAPWQEGARWFWDTLVDADLANNSMGWQWSAGSGADAAPYFRIFNPWTQSKRFDPQGRYIRRWVPELAELPDRDIHTPQASAPAILAAAGIQLGRDYPEPIIDYKTSREEALAAARAIRQS
ncbi:deoxyribodipyrimidine photo-lyase [Natronospira proteinivora]|uniref:Deoxyribodipyrimidine photo-lyase n=1 Tax=Natronospira proteinivora TaxID=1807133 RepID=A0ABT1G9I8_9GAMM|nr:deoxyribodipyrimidine photo-lyase [Natronospira proteinivora]MCP1727984.1 deoxyribodipyrimidine photo-lyase [Natronospira proteinivora]